MFWPPTMDAAGGLLASPDNPQLFRFFEPENTIIQKQATSLELRHAPIAPPMAPPISSPLAKEPEQDAVAKKRLLVVDDQVSLTKIVGTIAAEAGLDVRVVNDPNQAL